MRPRMRACRKCRVCLKAGELGEQRNLMHRTAGRATLIRILNAEKLRAASNTRTGNDQSGLTVLVGGEGLQYKAFHAWAGGDLIHANRRTHFA